MNTAFLVLCHQAPHYLAALAQHHTHATFYIHYDAKSPLSDLDFLHPLPNVHIIPERINIHWAGYSMVEAVLHLIQAALAHQEHRYFHLISGQCVLLHPLEHIEAQCQKLPENSLLLTSETTTRLRHRVRFNTPHANTHWQRSLMGKILTKSIQLLDFCLPTSQTAYVGSQWFSADRPALNTLFHAADTSVRDYFRHKLCPDEHFFQYLIAHKQLQHRLNHINQNHRFIYFNGTANHPEYLNITQLNTAAQHHHAWFARKVDEQTALAYLAQMTSSFKKS